MAEIDHLKGEKTNFENELIELMEEKESTLNQLNLWNLNCKIYLRT